MTPEEELAELAPEPEVQVWRRGEDGDMHPVIAESGEEHDRRLAVEEIWAAPDNRADGA